MLYEAFMAGVWSSLGSTVGKLSGTRVVVGDSYIIWAMLLVIMMFVNTWGCRCYLRSLDASTNSVAPTVISSASSYIFSGLIGVLLFNEASSIRWWLGTALIVQGLALVARSQNQNTGSKPMQNQQ